MKASNRRSFIKKLALGTAGSILAPSLQAKNGIPNFNPIDYELSVDTEDFWEQVKSQFRFQPNLYYFNNASLGSSPIPVREATYKLRATLDDFPSKYMWGAWTDEKENVRLKVANLFSVSKEEIAIIHNTTEGMNLIARSFELSAGDEIIISDHDHASGTIPWEVWHESNGVKIIRPSLPLLPKTLEEIVAIYRKAITPKTKIISMCHVVNTNGMVLPVKEISEMAHKYGVKIAVDGAQSAGMFTIDLKDLGCDYYAASAHKWLFAPKGIGVLYAKKESQAELKPLMVARGYKEKSIRRLENYNTRNLPEYLALGESVKFINAIGMDKIHARSYDLKHYFRSKISQNPKFIIKSPGADSLSCAIQTVEISGLEVKDVKQQLFDNYGIDTRPMSSFGLNGVRISFGIYITKADIDYLVSAMEAIAG